MLFSSLVLALSSSIDALGIGITYGIKNTKISFLAKVILFVISISISVLSIWFGNFIRNVLPDSITKLFGNLILIGMGFFVVIQAMNQDKLNFDLDYSNSIDTKEAFLLGFALSLDCFCIGSCGSAIGMSSFWFPLFISVFQFTFLSIGNALGKRLQHLVNLPNCVWSIVSGGLLVLIGFVRFISF